MNIYGILRSIKIDEIRKYLITLVIQNFQIENR